MMSKFGQFALSIFTLIILFDKYDSCNYSNDNNTTMTSFSCLVTDFLNETDNSFEHSRLFKIDSNDTNLPIITQYTNSLEYSELLKKNCPFFILIFILILIIFYLCIKDPEKKQLIIRLLKGVTQILRNQQAPPAPAPITLNVKYGKSIKKETEDLIFSEENDTNKKTEQTEI